MVLADPILRPARSRRYTFTSSTGDGTFPRWWSTEGQARISTWEQDTYFDPAFLQDLGFDQLTAPSRRRAWLTLLTRAYLERIGRTTDDQHRGFLRLSVDNGWLDAAARKAGHHDVIRRIVDHVDRRGSESLPHFHWFQATLGMVIFAEWLDEYVQAFSSVRKGTPYVEALSPRTSATLQQGGPDAPSVAPILGMGGCFVARELARRKLLPADAVAPYCYVPRKRVRTLVSLLLDLDLLEFENLGQLERSVLIHEALVSELGRDGARFEGGFDLPLQMIAYKDGLCRHVLGWTMDDEADDGADDQ